MLNRFRLRCRNCNAEFEVELEETSRSSSGKSMGDSILHCMELEDSCPCCGHMYECRIEVSEYPIGIMECYTPTQEENCDVLSDV